MDNLDKIVNKLFENEKFTLEGTYAQEKYTATKYTKSGQNCIFDSEYVNEENKEDINSLFNFADINKDGNLTYKELADAIYDIIDNTKYTAKLDLNSMTSYLKSKDINLNNIHSVLDFIKIGNKVVERSTNVQSGNFSIDGEPQTLQATKYSETGKNRTYHLTNPDNGQVQLATFGGQNPKTQQMVSEFYAKVFDNDELLAKPITYKDMDNLEGVVNPNINPKSLDQNKKLGLDVFFSNDEQFGYMSYAGTLDETSRSHNTIFSIIPTEFNTLLEQGSYSKNDIIEALETVVSISDNDIKATVAKYGNTQRYEDILLKRKDFFSKMLDTIKLTEQKEGESIKDYVQRIQISVINSDIDKLDNLADLNSYLKSISSLQNETMRADIEKRINARKESLQENNTDITPLEPFSLEQLEQTIDKFGGREKLREIMQNIYKRHEEFGKGSVDRLAYMLQESLNDELLKKLNDIRSKGIDVTQDEDSFVKFILYSSMTIRRSYNADAKMYKFITETISTSLPDDFEQKAIEYYKGNSYSNIHEGTDGLLLQDKEPNKKVIKEHIEALNNYLHKNKTQEDINVYRGEYSTAFSNIPYTDKQNLGEALLEINKELKKCFINRVEISTELKEKINKLVDFVNNKQSMDIVNTRFCSTSVDKNVADSFHSVTLDIDLPAGSSAVFIDAFNFSGNNCGETEVLTSYGAVEHITGAYFDDKAKRIVFKTTLITDT